MGESTATEALLGDIISERYDVQSLLGQGGMGAVFVATDRKLGRQVALKVIHANRAFDAVARARFAREARTAAGLDHREGQRRAADHVDPGAGVALACTNGTISALVPLRPARPVRPDR